MQTTGVDQADTKHVPQMNLILSSKRIQSHLDQRREIYNIVIVCGFYFGDID